MSVAKPRPPLVVAAALALGTAVSLGLARFSYALLLPAMRADLGWSYFVAGAMNTVNAAGYLAGALVAAKAVRRLGANAVLVGGTLLTALALAAHGVVASDGALYLLRFAAGLASAPSLVAGAVLAARLGGASARVGHGLRAGFVLGLYYGGTGIGIVAAALLVPLLAHAAAVHPWQPAWLALGAAGAVATVLIAIGVRGLGGASAGPPGGGSERFRLRPFAPALLAYVLFGLGYIGYMTFVVTLLREQQLAPGLVTAFYAVLGIAVVASSWIWAGMLQRFRGGESLAILNALLALATVLPLASAHPVAVFASGVLFGAVFLSLVTSTTVLIRHNVAPSLWAPAIAAFTVVFAAGQIVGPALVGFVADRFGGLHVGLACSAAVLALGALSASRQKPLAVIP